MRIRKRPPAAVEAARAPAVLRDKPESIPGALHGRVELTDRSERLIGGSVELPRVFATEEAFMSRDALEEAPERSPISNPVDEEQAENGSSKQEEISPGGSELLMKSLLVVFERAGTLGLTAREAVAKLLEYDLPGLQEGSHERSSVQVTKVLRTPDFVHLEGGKFYIYPSTPHAVVAESSTQSEPSQAISQSREDVSGNSPNFNLRRKRPDSNGHITSEFSDKNVFELEKVELKKRRRRPPSSQHELAIGPRQCKRYDGRGWQCSRETEEGFSFCEHHQALMNKRTLRLNLAKLRRRGGSNQDMDAEPPQPKSGAVEGSSGNSNEQVVEKAPHGIEDLIHNQRRKLVKARSLKSIK